MEGDMSIDNISSENIKYWEKKTYSNNGMILVEGLHRTPTYIYQSGRLAKAIQQEKKLNISVLHDTVLSSLYESFGISGEIKIKKFFLVIRATAKAMYSLISSYNDISIGESLLEFKIKNLTIGDLIYDTIIRSSNKYTIEKLNYADKYIVFKSIVYYYIYKEILNSNQIKYLIVSHVAYNKFGILARLAKKTGIKVVLVANKIVKNYHEFHIKDNKLKPTKQLIDSITKEEINQAKVILKDRLNGSINQHDVLNAYKDKKVYSRFELNHLLSLDNSKKNIFIFPHAFSDAPHNSQRIIAKDYYDWFIKTLNIIDKIQDVNWIIKPHPSAKMYNEFGEVEKILSHNKSNHIFLTPSNFSTSSIINIAHAVVTVQGTVALEYACYGVPNIICGDAYYNGFGFTNEAITPEKYESSLRELKFVTKLSNEQINQALKVFYAIYIKSKVKDNIIPDNFVLPDSTNDIETELIKTISSNLKRYNPKQTEFYNYCLNLAKKL